MSERADQAREEQSRLTNAIFRELAELVDATIPDQLLAVTIEERRAVANRPLPQSRDYSGDDRVIEPLVTRIVAELDDDDLCLYVRQEAKWLLRRHLESGHVWAGRRPRSGPNRVAPVFEDDLRATVERQLTEALRKHLRDRAEEFMPGEAA